MSNYRAHRLSLLTELGASYRFCFNAIDIERVVRQVFPGTAIRKNDGGIAYLLPQRMSADIQAADDQAGDSGLGEGVAA
jgi:hypothetical protein